jgi:hypothetical protein
VRHVHRRESERLDAGSFHVVASCDSELSPPKNVVSVRRDLAKGLTIVLRPIHTGKIQPIIVIPMAKIATTVPQNALRLHSKKKKNQRQSPSKKGQSYCYIRPSALPVKKVSHELTSYSTTAPASCTPPTAISARLQGVCARRDRRIVRCAVKRKVWMHVERDAFRAGEEARTRRSTLEVVVNADEWPVACNAADHVAWLEVVASSCRCCSRGKQGGGG